MAPNKTLKGSRHHLQVVSTGQQVCKWSISDIFAMILENVRMQRVVTKVFSTKNNRWYRWAQQFLIDKLDIKVHLKNSMTLDTKLLICSKPSNYNLQVTKSTDFYETPSKVLNDYESLFLKNKYSDVTFIVDGKEFPAHKAILTARSSVFSTMFEHNTKGGHMDRKFIEGIQPEVLQELLRFIYVGKIEKLDIYYKDLLVLADTYGLEVLKTVCLNYMSKTINIENSIDFLMFADKYSVEKLKVFTMDFIVEHFKEIVKTEDFDKLKFLSAPIFIELIEKLAFIQAN